MTSRNRRPRNSLLKLKTKLQSWAMIKQTKRPRKQDEPGITNRRKRRKANIMTQKDTKKEKTPDETAQTGNKKDRHASKQN